MSAGRIALTRASSSFDPLPTLTPPCFSSPSPLAASTVKTYQLLLIFDLWPWNSSRSWRLLRCLFVQNFILKYSIVVNSKRVEVLQDFFVKTFDCFKTKTVTLFFCHRDALKPRPWVSRPCVGHSPSTCFPLDVGGTPDVSPSRLLQYPDVSPSLYCYMRIDRALDIGIIFSVSMVKECSKHQILLCYH